MLKIWKQTWKKEESARHPHSEQHSDAQVTPLSGTSGGGSPKNSAAAVPPSTGDVNLGPVFPRGRRGTTKRTRANDAAVSVDSDTDRPRKKTRLDDDEYSLGKDTLGNHLPEVIAADAAIRPETPPLNRATFEEKLFNQAKTENSECMKQPPVTHLQMLSIAAVAVFTSIRVTSKIVADYLTWAVDLERSLPESETPRARRTALLVTK
jgi:endoribonuclease Dicer